MKSLKAAAVLAGSIVIAGAAAPAFATDVKPTSPKVGLNPVLEKAVQTTKPVTANAEQALDGKKKDSVVKTVSDAAKSVNSGNGPAKLLGGLPLAK
ncbi:hypothetical protein [Streptomyces aureocirculatus]|uniref:hypothetical protein n=1 Tax=Streptomyces aureocirculatus TaxID=67275 RepID=UPI0004C87DE4|nr:hypothetical protein [Streptomyces aureocirculatus]